MYFVYTLDDAFEFQRDTENLFQIKVTLGNFQRKLTKFVLHCFESSCRTHRHLVHLRALTGIEGV